MAPRDSDPRSPTEDPNQKASRVITDLTSVTRLLEAHDPQERLAICSALLTMAVASMPGERGNFLQLGQACAVLGIAGKAGGEQLGDLACALLLDVLGRDFAGEGSGPVVRVQEVSDEEFDSVREPSAASPAKKSPLSDPFRPRPKARGQA